MLSDDGLTKQITITAPASGSCTFSGNYKYGSFAVNNFANTVVNVCVASCVRPADKCIEASTVSNNCGGVCTGSWTVTRRTPSDTNCDNAIDRTELGSSINKYVNGQIDRTIVGLDIQAWAV